MNAIAIPLPRSRGGTALALVAAAWYAVAAAGHWLFVYYLAIAYGAPTWAGDAAAWNRKAIVGHVAGDTAGNALFISHVLLAIVLSLGGLLQLAPQVRQRWPALHRWNGRLFLAIAAVAATSGLLMTWWRGAHLSLGGAVGISVNAVLILFFSALALRYARHGQFARHRRWALRCFMVVNGVWFYRLGFSAWILLNQGPRWSTPAVDGPFDLAWAFGCYLLPLAVLELYFLAQRVQSARVRMAIVVTLAGFTALTALGVFGAYQLLWKPHL
ncbi:DUF2306 domain-containing protein [Tahibacter amnicola]|uniref:DUF2306 domain-containing protein n=1 Tax=Tahibacter amnicola TaxID=2976241 RepID=A0ABY6B8I1_9GAMM|nr:DUF2306 domain-containing protein [Tahibacter amnicola]UXI65872.1 DUF2306 domain-containing protein [Tahibacter amnicola]